MKNPLKEQSLSFSVFVVVVLVVVFSLPYFLPAKKMYDSAPAYTTVSFEKKTYMDTTDLYDIQGLYPKAIGESDRASQFNDRITRLVSSEIADFVDDTEDPIEGIDLPKSSLSFDYEVSEGNGIAKTISFEFSQYIQGAAHPYSYIITTSFDEVTLEEVTLEDMFGTDLKILSDRVKEQIEKTFSEEDQAVFFQSRGLDPASENYRNFVITDTGIIFIFNPYQIAPYVYGTIRVPVPYSKFPVTSNALFIPK